MSEEIGRVGGPKNVRDALLISSETADRNRHEIYEFGPFHLEPAERKLSRGDEVVTLTPKVFDMLVMLVRHSGHLLEKDDLIRSLWPDSFVEEGNLSNNIFVLRKALGNDREYIETVPRRGYRFVGAVRQLPPAVGNAISGVLEGQIREVPSRQKRRGWKLLFAGIAAALLLFAAVFIFRRIRGENSVSIRRADRTTAKTTASSRMHVVPLTTLPGNAFGSAFSPDGEKISFFWDGENPVHADLYVQLVGGERPLRLTHTSSGFICCADWSPDGLQIAFGRCDDSGGGVFTVPALGGPERKLTDVVCHFGRAGYPKWIGNGRSLLIVDRCVPGGPGAIVVFSLETGEKRCLTDPPLYSVSGDTLPTLSPDGKTVAFSRVSTVWSSELYTVALSGGNLRQLTHDRVPNDSGGVLIPMWSSDGQRIIFSAGGLGRVWRVPAAGGAIEPETIYPKIGALSRDGRRLAYGLFGDSSMDIWRVALSSPGGRVVSRNRIIESPGGNSGPQPSPDGQQIVFESCRSGQCAVWRAAADGSNPQQMTSFDSGQSGTPRWSPDGKWIAVDHNTPTHSQIYLIDSEGRNLHLIASGDYENCVTAWSRDGTAVYFASNRTGSWQVWRQDLATGRETQVTHHGGFAAFESYDAKTIYYSKFEGGGIWSIPVGGGEEKQITDALHLGFWGHFAVTDAGLYLLDTDASPRPMVMFYSFQTRRLTPVMQLEKKPYFWTAGLAASRDGRTVFFAQGDFHASIVMVENFQ